MYIYIFHQVIIFNTPKHMYMNIYLKSQYNQRKGFFIFLEILTHALEIFAEVLKY